MGIQAFTNVAQEQLRSDALPDSANGVHGIRTTELLISRVNQTVQVLIRMVKTCSINPKWQKNGT